MCVCVCVCVLCASALCVHKKIFHFFRLGMCERVSATTLSPMDNHHYAAHSERCARRRKRLRRIEDVMEIRHDGNANKDNIAKNVKWIWNWWRCNWHVRRHQSVYSHETESVESKDEKVGWGEIVRAMSAKWLHALADEQRRTREEEKTKWNKTNEIASKTLTESTEREKWIRSRDAVISSKGNFIQMSFFPCAHHSNGTQKATDQSEQIAFFLSSFAICVRCPFAVGVAQRRSHHLNFLEEFVRAPRIFFSHRIKLNATTISNAIINLWIYRATFLRLM